ncbi:MAG: serine hydrolase [Candidatus Korobacteraceae bacterium]
MKQRVCPFRSLVTVLVLLAGVLPGFSQLTAPAAKPAPDRFQPLDLILQTAVVNKLTPGVVCIVGHNGAVIYRKAFGFRSVNPMLETMTVDTVFDMASLTKVMATTGSILRMVQLGQIKLNDPVAKYIPDFAQNGKEDVTIRQLLTHYSGLRADLDLRPTWSGMEEGYRRANAEKLINPPGSTFLYSDINFIVLGELVQKVGGITLNQYAETFIFGPLGMNTTRFLPPLAWLARTAPTQVNEKTGEVLRAVVHDPTARAMGGVAGHAGLFSTADDTAKFAQAMLNGGAPVWSREIVEKMTTPQQPPNLTVVRGLGWDIDSPFSSNRGDLLPVGSYGHTGFTGTSLWIDPTTDSYIILLTNAVHLKGGTVIALRTEVATAVASILNLSVPQEQKYRLSRITGYNEVAAASRRIVARNGRVLLGIDELESSDFEALRQFGTNKPRIGLLTNQAAVDSLGHRTIDVLAHGSGLHLAGVFDVDGAESAASKDPATGVPVYGLGGDQAGSRPSIDALRNFDVIVVDVQDTGARVSPLTLDLAAFLDTAAKAGKPVVILDRPNPLNGAYVQGPVVDAGHAGYQSLPPRHGLTVAELAKLLNAERNINAKLTVVPMKGWIRGDWFDSTGLLWVNPAPDIKDVQQMLLYSGVALLEGTDISIRKGANSAYEMLGAPWIHAVEFAEYLNERKIEGVRFLPVQFTPALGKHARQQCGGVNIMVIDRETLDPAELGIELAAALHKLYPKDFDMTRLSDSLGNQSVVQALQNGEDPRRIADDWRDGLDQFMQVRAKYLIY